MVMLPLKRNVKSGKPWIILRTSFRLVSSRASLFLARPGAGGCRPALIQPQLDHFSDYHRQIRSQGGPIFLRLLLLLQPLMPQLPGWLEAARKKISKNSKTFDTRSKITRRKFKNSKLPNPNFNIFNRLFRNKKATCYVPMKLVDVEQTLGKLNFCFVFSSSVYRLELKT